MHYIHAWEKHLLMRTFWWLFLYPLPVIFDPINEGQLVSANLIATLLTEFIAKQRLTLHISLSNDDITTVISLQKYLK